MSTRSKQIPLDMFAHPEPDDACISNRSTTLQDYIWKAGVELLGGDPKARALIGRMVKEHGRERVGAVIGSILAMEKRPIDPVSYFVKALHPPPRRVVV